MWYCAATDIAHAQRSYLAQLAFAKWRFALKLAVDYS